MTAFFQITGLIVWAFIACSALLMLVMTAWGCVSQRRGGRDRVMRMPKTGWDVEGGFLEREGKGDE